MGCYNSAVINAPVDEVWKVLRDFHDLSWSQNVVQKVEAQGDRTTVGAKRILNGAFHETLLALDDGERVVRYSIDDGPGAVSKDNVQGYVGEIRAFPVTRDDATFVLWTSSWQSSGGGVAEFCNPVYKALLDDLVQHFA